MATSVAAIAEAVGGAITKLNASPTAVSSAPLPSEVASSGSGYTVGTPSLTVASGNPQGSIAPVASVPVNNVPGYNPFGPTGNTTVNAQITVNASGSNATAPAIAQAIVNQLRASGARF